MPKNSHRSRCCVSSCDNNIVNREATIFRFPTNQDLAQKWIAAIQCEDIVPEDAVTFKSKYVCSKHFERTSFQTAACKKLLRGAVPTSIAEEETVTGNFFETNCVQPNVLHDHSYSSSHASSGLEAGQSPCDISHGNILHTTSPSPHVLKPVSCVYGRSMCNISSDATTQSASVIYSSFNSPNTHLSSTPVASGRTHRSLKFGEPFETDDISKVDDILAFPLDRFTGTASTPGKTKQIGISKKKRSSLLSKINAVTLSDLSPKKRTLFKHVKSKSKALSALKKKLDRRNATIKDYGRLLENPTMEHLTKKMSPAAGNFLLSQLRCAGRQPRGRRWTLDDKIMALSIQKRSPAAYSLMRCMFVLPCRRTLTHLLNSAPFACGIDFRVLNLLKRLVKQMNSRDKYCAIVFDEMCVRKHLCYCMKEDKIVGFEDDGVSRTDKEADHVLVFLIRGLGKQWKQPIASFFSHGGMKQAALKAAIEKVVLACISVGLNVVATVCDMGTSNVAAFKLLGAKFPDPVVGIGGISLAIVFDPPHLLKCIRNMFLKYIVRGISLKGNLNIVGAARWEHIVKVYKEEQSNALFSLVPKLNDSHINPSSIQKMKVSTAAQVMSHSVAAAVHSYVSAGKLPAEANITAAFLSDVDRLFDSFNGSKPYPESGKPLRCRLSDTSPHLQFWSEEAKAKVHNWRFLKKSNLSVSKPPPVRPGKQAAEVTRPPSQWGWITTINAAIHIWNVLSDAGFDYLQMKALNQDPLENLFGCIRAYCGSNSNPSCYQFIAALKTAIVNGMAYKECFKGNCQADDAILLNDLKEFLLGEAGEEKSVDDSLTNDHVENPLSNDHIDNPREVNSFDEEQALNDCDTAVFSLAYVSGFVARKLLAKFHCAECTIGLTSIDEEMFNVGIWFKEFNDDKRSLTYPSETLVLLVGKCAAEVELFLAEKGCMKNLMSTLFDIIVRKIDFEQLKQLVCVGHFSLLQNDLIKNVCFIMVKFWCKKKNRHFVAATKKTRESVRKMNILKKK